MPQLKAECERVQVIISHVACLLRCRHWIGAQYFNRAYSITCCSSCHEIVTSRRPILQRLYVRTWYGIITAADRSGAMGQWVDVQSIGSMASIFAPGHIVIVARGSSDVLDRPSTCLTRCMYWHSSNPDE